MAKGVPANIALQDAYRAMQGMVMKQASVLSYMDVFLYVGIMFLVFVPVVLIFIKKSKAKVSMADAAH